ncbi:cyanophycinase [Flavihumibacter rivuli]|uniref:cyanophycinase n=1 Tax=Flavihumibacter rivuli TaxID=2838156 RepID=UPI001BDE792E|nr:cyanophycinase [Flavihumibacter rivuli]ULQ56894.1 cyanophycinase [Flavihumibacter rivuli]
MRKILFGSLSALAVLTACSKSVAPKAVAQPESGLNAKAPGGSGSIVTYLTGDAADVQTSTSAGLMLMGGSTDVDAAIQWMISKSGGGDAVVIRSSGADGYNAYMYGLGTLNSVETIIIDTRTKALDASVAQKIRNAEMLFIAGGDQWNYVSYWKDTPVEDAINYLINTKKVPVGGTSAGLAILGSAYYTAQNGSVTSAQALGDPYHRYSTIDRDNFINAPLLANTITDSHYTQRDRQGRHISWLARMMKDWGMTTVRGIGVDEQTAVCVEANGLAKVYGTNKAYFLSNNGLGAETCLSRTSLTWNRNQQAVRAYAITGSATGNGSVDLNTWNSFSGGTAYFYFVNNGTLAQN